MEAPTTDEERRSSAVVAAALGVPPDSFVPTHGLSLKMNHEFSLSDLPPELAAVLRDYDVDNSGSVSVAELVGGAQLMRQQAKKNKLMTKIVIALTVLLLLLLAGNFGLVWAVVVFNTPTTLSSANVLTAKSSGDAVQVSSADFYYDSSGLLQLRNPNAQMTMDWVSPSASSSSADTSAASGTGRRRLLQDSGFIGTSSTPTTTVDLQTTQFTPTCNFSSPDFYTNSSYFFTGTCTFTKLVQMRTLVLPVLSSKTSAQVGGSIIDAAAWKAGPQTVYKGCFGGTSSNWNQNILSSSTSLANCETLAVNGADANSSPYTAFGFTGSNTSTTGTCYACSASNSSCTPTATSAGTNGCGNSFGIRVFQVLRSPNRYQNSGPGAMANSPIPIAGGMPAAPAWSYVTLAITRVDYVRNVFRDASNPMLTVCQANLLRFYVQPMVTTGTVTTVNGGFSSYIDVCLTPMPRATSFGTGSTTWIGNYTVHSTGTSSVFITSSSANAYYDRPSVGTSFATPSNTDFQSVLSYFCINCPSGPYIDYSNLQYDTDLFELPCTKKGISWRYRDVYSNQGCPAWDPSNPSAQSNCSWTTAETGNYGGPAGPKICLLTMEAFTQSEPVYTFDNQMSFLTNTGRNMNFVQKTQSAAGDSGIPPLYSYSGNSAFARPLWQDYFNTSGEAIAAVSSYMWFTSSRTSLPLVASSSRRHLLAADPIVNGTISFNSQTYKYIGDCADKNGRAVNGYDTSTTRSCAPVTGSCRLMSYGVAKVCRCVPGPVNATENSQFCHAGAPYCRYNVPLTTDGCFSATTGTVSASIMAA